MKIIHISYSKVNLVSVECVNSFLSNYEAFTSRSIAIFQLFSLLFIINVKKTQTSHTSVERVNYQMILIS